jgi:hypothetical protein
VVIDHIVNTTTYKTVEFFLFIIIYPSSRSQQAIALWLVHAVTEANKTSLSTVG